MPKVLQPVARQRHHLLSRRIIGRRHLRLPGHDPRVVPCGATDHRPLVAWGYRENSVIGLDRPQELHTPHGSACPCTDEPPRVIDLERPTARALAVVEGRRDGTIGIQAIGLNSVNGIALEKRGDAGDHVPVTHEALGIEVDFSLPSERVIRSLEQIIEWRGKPGVLRCDNGPEYVSALVFGWAESKGIQIEHIQPGKPQQNAYVERFNRTVRYEWLAQYEFGSLGQVQDYATRWIWNYNNERPNMALGGITPKQRLAMAA